MMFAISKIFHLKNTKGTKYLIAIHPLLILSIFSQKLKILICFLCLLLVHINCLSLTHTSKNNYTGNWDNPLSWEASSPAPATSNITDSIIIQGRIKRKGNLSFKSGYLEISDTLLVEGNLLLGQNNDLFLKQNSVMIVMGNVEISDTGQTIIMKENAYLVITGNYIVHGNRSSGEIITEDDKPKIFIGGNITPIDLIEDHSGYEALSCSNTDYSYLNTGCSYGNMDDFQNEELYDYLTSSDVNPDFQPVIITTQPLDVETCGNEDVIFEIEAINVKSFQWMILNNGERIELNNGVEYVGTNTKKLLIKSVQSYLNGAEYYCILIDKENDSTVTRKVMLTIHDLKLNPISYDSIACTPNMVLHTENNGNISSWEQIDGPNESSITTSGSLNEIIYIGNTVGGVYSYKWTLFNDVCSKDTTIFIHFIQTPQAKIIADTIVCGKVAQVKIQQDVGYGYWKADESLRFEQINDNFHIYSNKYTSKIVHWISTNDFCSDTSSLEIQYKNTPIAYAGEDMILMQNSSCQLHAELGSNEQGVWSVLTGDGYLTEYKQPDAIIENLSFGENVLLWTITDGYCSAMDTLSIVCNQLRIPNIITPNGDGKNDVFIIDNNEHFGTTLIVFNRWGKEVFYSNNYENDWGGQGKNGTILPADTYYFILEFANGNIIKSHVLLRK